MEPLVVLYNHIHKALGGEMDNLEGHALSLDPENAEAVVGFAGHLGMIHGLLEVHANEEEGVLWPEIEKQMPGLMGSYEIDHEAEREIFARIDSHLAALQQSGTDKKAISARLARDVGVAAEQLKLHMRKEESHIYTPFSEGIGEAAQMELGRQILSNLPVEILPQAMPWLASFLTAEEVAEGFDLYVKAVGPERGQLFITPLATGLPPGKWQEVLQHAPQLASYAV
jgi:iron-sulfur cluster repair protein YtfE (RIC family)